MKTLLFLIIFYSLNSFAVAQNSIIQIAKAEKNAFKNFEKIEQIQYPGDRKIDVIYYKLNLKLEYPPTKYLVGAVTIGAKSNYPSLTSFFLDLQDALNVDSVKMGNKKLSFTHSNAKLQITLDSAYGLGKRFFVTVYYEGIPGSSGFGSFEFSTHKGQPVIWSLSEPYGASDWFQNKDTPSDKADSSKVWVTCDSNLIAVSNGLLQKVINNHNGTFTYKWKNSYPIAQYLISIAVSNYKKYVTYYHYAVNDSMPIENYIYPESFNAVKSYLNLTAEMISIFSKKFGQYPFIKEKYGQVQFGWSGGMENQTITSLGAFGADIQSHELAHQWFGDKVTCADWNDIWLNEGFATYSQAIYHEVKNGESTYKSFMQNLMKTAFTAKGSIYVNNISSVNNIFNYARSYAKGAVVLYMLRGIVGDSTFFRILRSYLDDPRFAYGVATTSDFESVAEKIYGKKLDYFFNEWIFGQNYPSYSVHWNYSVFGNDIYNVKLNINQTTNIIPRFFTMPIQLKFHTAIGDTLITVFNNQQNQVFNIAIKGKPKYFDFDPNDLILKKIAVIDYKDLTKPLSFALEQNYPNPFNPVTNIAYDIPVTPQGFVHVKLIIYDVLGNEVEILVDKVQPANHYSVKFYEKNLPSGIYIYTLKAGNYFTARKMVLLK